MAGGVRESLSRSSFQSLVTSRWAIRPAAVDVLSVHSHQLLAHVWLYRDDSTCSIVDRLHCHKSAIFAGRIVNIGGERAFRLRVLKCSLRQTPFGNVVRHADLEFLKGAALSPPVAGSGSMATKLDIDALEAVLFRIVVGYRPDLDGWERERVGLPDS